MPTIELNFVAILIAVVCGFFLSFAWYTLLFGKIWKKEMGMEDEPEPTGKVLIRGLAITLLGIIFMVFVLANNIQAWSPSAWGINTQDISVITQALSAAFFSWIGFIVPELLSSVAWEKKSWKLFAINAGYYLIALLTYAFILLLI